MATRGRPSKKTPVAAAAESAVTQHAGLRSAGRYDAAGSGRRLAGWNPPNSGPRRAVQGTTKMRDRSRDATRNDWTGESAGQKWGAALIGVGIVPRWNRIKSIDRKQAIVDLWNDWLRVADSDGVLDFYGLQTLAVRSWFESGEVFLRLRYRRKDSSLPVPLQVQLLEADYVPLNFDTDAWPGLPKGNRICQGIELNSYSQRVAYWMYRDHPGEVGSTARTPSPGTMVRVPADQVRHLYVPKRAGQLRGVSELSSVLVRLRNAGDFEDAVLTRQQLANLWTVFITRALPPDAADIEYDSDTGLPKWYDKEGNPVVKLQAGMSQELAPGEDVKFPNPPEAGTTYSDYLRTVHMGTAAASGLPYELFSGDLKDVSDRTLRVVMLEFRRLARQRQWQNIIPMICQPVMDAWAEQALLVDLITAAEYDDVRRVKWSPEGFEHIHPVQDPQGKIMEMDAGLVSRDELIAERGDDPAEVDQQRKDAQERAKELKLDPPAPKPGAAGQPGQQQQQEDGQPPAKALGVPEIVALITAAQPPAPVARQDDPVVMAVLGAMQTMMGQISALVTAQSEQAAKQSETQAAMQAQVAATVALLGEQQAKHAQMADAMLAALEAIANAAAAPVVQVQVEPTPINVAAPQVVVNNEQAPVEVTVKLPDREIVTENVEHDKDGRITSVRQVERTIQ